VQKLLFGQSLGKVWAKFGQSLGQRFGKKDLAKKIWQKRFGKKSMFDIKIKDISHNNINKSFWVAAVVAWHKDYGRREARLL
jgi:hypothetical protein